MIPNIFSSYIYKIFLKQIQNYSNGIVLISDI